MNKDAILATIIGFGIGLVIAAAVFLGPSVFKNMPKVSLPNFSWLVRKFGASDSAKPTPTPAPNETLTIQSPLPEAIESKNETLVSGTVAPDSIIVIEGESSETVAVANAQGAYAGKLSLGEGKNTITVTSYTKEKMQTQTVTVYYTPEDF